MKINVLCEGTTDLLMIQFVMQYKYGWKYKEFSEDKEKNRLLKRICVRENDELEITACGGVNNIPKKLSSIKERLSNATRETELYNKIILMIDHDTINSNQEFISQLNQDIDNDFDIEQINNWSN